MALKKEITSSNGIKTTYHKISSIKKNGSYFEINLESYADDTYRDEQKNYENLIKEINDLDKKKQELMLKYDEVQDESVRDEIIKLTDIISEKNKGFDKYVNISLNNNIIDIQKVFIDYSDTISFFDIYEYLKTTELFRDAEDA